METKNKSVWARAKGGEPEDGSQLATDNQDTTKITATKVTPQRSRTTEQSTPDSSPDYWSNLIDTIDQSDKKEEQETCQRVNGLAPK